MYSSDLLFSTDELLWLDRDTFYKVPLGHCPQFSLQGDNRQTRNLANDVPLLLPIVRRTDTTHLIFQRLPVLLVDTQGVYSQSSQAVLFAAIGWCK